jgi:hypothetical protein
MVCFKSMLAGFDQFQSCFAHGWFSSNEVRRNANDQAGLSLLVSTDSTGANQGRSATGVTGSATTSHYDEPTLVVGIR